MPHSVERGCQEGRGNEGRKAAASRGLETGRKWRRPREGRQGGTSSLCSCFPNLSPRKKKWKYKLGSLALNLSHPHPHHTHIHTETKRKAAGDTSHQPGYVSSQEWPGRWSLPGPSASQRKGRGFLLAPLPRSSLLQSRSAASLTPPAPLGPGTRTTCFQPPPPPLSDLA